MLRNNFRIGVDVGGTNTDGVILDPSSTSTSDRGILAWHKSPTTDDPSQGIEKVITTLFQKSNLDPSSISSVTIGTTHFVNAVIEKDHNRLAPVAIIRLCGPFSQDVPPGVDWPEDLRNLICVHTAYLKGGLEVDGDLISAIDETEIIKECDIIKAKGIKSVVINGIFSPSDLSEKQEESARDIVRKHLPDTNIVISKEVANLGFLERENAAVLNASILTFARRTIKAFRRAMTRLDLTCPIFLTQNDGTVLPAHLAARLPIRTFASGPSNSICSAKFLAQENLSEALLVIDVGGTTTDCGMLLASGFPRQSAAITEVVGIRMNYSCPDVRSIGLGGGSIVRKNASRTIEVGPDSVGHYITQKALLFGGDIPTATDYAVASTPTHDIGDLQLLKGIAVEDLDAFKAIVKAKLEALIDKMKTTADDIPVMLVGGGALISPEILVGASRVIKPKFAGVANAIGAAIAKVSGTIDMVVDTAEKDISVVLQEVSKLALESAVNNGAKRETISITEMDSIPLQYVANKVRVIVKAVGDFDFSRKTAILEEESGEMSEDEAVPKKRPSQGKSEDKVVLDVFSHRPKVVNREWFISEKDLDFISCGCYILGTGGGGSPYPHFIRLREMMRKGAVVRVMDPHDLTDDAVVAGGGEVGSPTVSMEKLPAGEMMECQNLLYEHMKAKPDAVMALEIGGGNGLQGLILGASTNMNIPCIDGDWMGRAYPMLHQITPCIYEKGALFLPTVIADGNGNTMMFLRATSEHMVERMMRAALSEMGSKVAMANGPFPGSKTKEYIVENTISLAWRIGRAVAACRQHNELEEVAEAIIDEAGGGKVLFKGKIVEVARRLIKGHSYGEIVIEAADISGKGTVEYKGKMKIPFKNENILATLDDEVIASVPDLISVIDAQSGEALGTPEYRYGLFVLVIGIAGSPRWTSSEEGIALGGPRAFGFDVEYKPLAEFKRPRSVIEEYSQ